MITQEILDVVCPRCNTVFNERKEKLKEPLERGMSNMIDVVCTKCKHKFQIDSKKQYKRIAD